MRYTRSLAAMALVALSLGGAGLSRVAVARQAADPAPTAPATYTVTAGFGDRNGAGYANSGLMAAKGKSWSLTFTKPGTYGYDCLVHPGMDGTITVLP